MKHNGYPSLTDAPVPIIAGAGVDRRLTLPPVVGRVRARIAYPITIAPTVSGRYGRAWLIDLETIRRRYPKLQDAQVVHWMIEAPWSHEVVHSYSLIVIHLRPLAGTAPVRKYRLDATHEVHLFAIHPAAPRHRLLGELIDPTIWLQPIIFVGQIAEPTDAAATLRAAHAVDLILAGRLSPEPRHVQAWAEIFGNDVLKHAVAPDLSEEGSVG